VSLLFKSSEKREKLLKAKTAEDVLSVLMD
jgi:mannitol/fructose-specific phosphotransferase system IIA component (Ntr-type)